MYQGLEFGSNLGPGYGRGFEFSTDGDSEKTSIILLPLIATTLIT